MSLVEVRRARKRAVSLSVRLVVSLSHIVERWSPAGLARVMSDGSKCMIDATKENLYSVCCVCKFWSWLMRSIVSTILSNRSLMYCLANSWEPMGCPRKRTPVVISARSGSSGQRKDSASCTFCCALQGNVSQAVVPVIVVNIFVLE